MKFKVGDIIVFKHEKQCGTILKIVNGKQVMKAGFLLLAHFTHI